VDKTIGRVDFGKTLLKSETVNYTLAIRENRTTYCPKSYFLKSSNFDTVQFKNRRLDESIRFLLEKNKTVTRFSYFKYNPKIDLLFISKSNSKEDNLDTLINTLKRVFDFEIQKEIQKYQFTLLDSVQSQNVSSGKRSKSLILLKKTEIIFVNQDINTISRTIGAEYNIFVDSDIHTKKKYSMKCPRNNFDKLKLVLLENGIEIKTSVSNDDFVAIEFNHRTI
jgi:hypothetical protein